MSQTEDYSAEAGFPDDSEKLLWRSRVFNTVSCLVRTKNIKEVRETFLQGFKKMIDQHVHSESAWAWRLGRGSYQRSYQNWCPRKGGISSLFLTWTFFTSGQCALFFNN